jgi:hypothetical protein
MLLAVSGRKMASAKRSVPETIIKSLKIHLHESFSANTPPMTGPKDGAAFVAPIKIPKYDPLSAGIAISAMMP